MSWSDVFSFQDYGELLGLLYQSVLAGAVLGVVGGVVGVFVVARGLAFAVHGIAELSFAGAAFALLVGANVVQGSLIGSVVAALAIGALGVKAHERGSVIGVLMPFGLGLGVLFLSLYQGRSANKFSLLTGQIVSVNAAELTTMAVGGALVLAAMAVMWRPLMFASTDPFVAEARGIPVRGLSLAFMLVLGVSVALSIQVVGALLVMALMVTPAAAATLVASRPSLVVALSVVFAMVSVCGGILVALGSRVPISPFVTTISFGIYVVCRLVGKRRRARPAVAGA
ncbi:metal ABC transporter permease [Falsarthrobacter nasiphocae]|uniref:Zinc/manganese transport system permease protein n=1 Tax=Falsarthrobacter nasiphocae TaxID=189863 RepID=A0AAE4C712_9MICC|nr:metal ABC transporter permease [Falsarthrobacter nasiphocae]MDR6892747.1 zinc/manganese transport system permease protein [Falsarthrobacter nasiphocae]